MLRGESQVIGLPPLHVIHVYIHVYTLICVQYSTGLPPLHVFVYSTVHTCLYANMYNACNTCIYTVTLHVCTQCTCLMRDERRKEERSKQANKQQGKATQHTQGSHFSNVHVHTSSFIKGVDSIILLTCTVKLKELYTFLKCYATNNYWFHVAIVS